MHGSQAVVQLEAVAEGGDENWVIDVLLRRLADDDAGVVTAALDSSLLLRVPAASLFGALTACLDRATAALQSGSTVQAAGNIAGQRCIARKVCLRRPDHISV